MDDNYQLTLKNYSEALGDFAAKQLNQTVMNYLGSTTAHESLDWTTLPASMRLLNGVPNTDLQHATYINTQSIVDAILSEPHGAIERTASKPIVTATKRKETGMTVYDCLVVAVKNTPTSEGTRPASIVVDTKLMASSPEEATIMLGSKFQYDAAYSYHVRVTPLLALPS